MQATNATLPTTVHPCFLKNDEQGDYPCYKVKDSE